MHRQYFDCSNECIDNILIAVTNAMNVMNAMNAMNVTCAVDT